MNPTSSYPYQTYGPIDFSKLNFVETKQIEHLIPNGSGTLTLGYVEVTQTYNPLPTFWTITGIVFIFVTITVFFTWAIAKRSKQAEESFGEIDEMLST